jgi:hypothetical protein
MQKQFVSVEAAHVKLSRISDAQTRVTQQENKRPQALRIASAGALAIRLKGSNNASHLFSRKSVLYVIVTGSCSRRFD